MSERSIVQEILQLDKDLDFGDVYGDSTCVETYIHYPVDWVLIRDVIRTITKALEIIRENYFKIRMNPPSSFLTQINKLCIAMTQSKRRKESKKYRKKTFREMKKILNKVKKHGERYTEKLTEIKEGKAKNIKIRLDNVLEQIPAIIKQCTTRIIQEKLVPRENKILSIYEKDVHVIVRGKSKNQVEFGNSLYVCEQVDGFIVDWEYSQNYPLLDGEIAEISLKKIKEKTNKVKSFTGDRIFPTKKLNHYLESEGIANNITPKSVTELEDRLKDKDFVKKQKRRGQTEGRIGIVKNVFLQNVMKRKGFVNRERGTALAVLVHNLKKCFLLYDDTREERGKIA